MPYFHFMIRCFLLLLLFASCAGPRRAAQAPSFADNPVVAHRGAFKKNGFPENSIAALREAIRLGCTGSEFDVRMSADDSLIINHDPHYAKLDVEQSTFAQLAATPLSNGEPLPTLRQYLTEGLRQNRATRLVLEIKPSPAGAERGRRIADKVVALVKEMKAEPMVVYISFDYGIVKRVLELAPQAPVQYLNGDKSPTQLRADGVGGLDYHFSVFKLHPEWIASAKQQGLILNAWTVNDRPTMQALLDSGFHFITTNEPELLLELSRVRGE